VPLWPPKLDCARISRNLPPHFGGFSGAGHRVDAPRQTSILLRHLTGQEYFALFLYRDEKVPEGKGTPGSGGDPASNRVRVNVEMAHG